MIQVDIALEARMMLTPSPRRVFQSFPGYEQAVMKALTYRRKALDGSRTGIPNPGPREKSTERLWRKAV